MSNPTNEVLNAALEDAVRYGNGFMRMQKTPEGIAFEHLDPSQYREAIEAMEWFLKNAEVVKDE